MAALDTFTGVVKATNYTRLRHKACLTPSYQVLLSRIACMAWSKAAIYSMLLGLLDIVKISKVTNYTRLRHKACLTPSYQVLLSRIACMAWSKAAIYSMLLGLLDIVKISN